MVFAGEEDRESEAQRETHFWAPGFLLWLGIQTERIKGTHTGTDIYGRLAGMGGVSVRERIRGTKRDVGWAPGFGVRIRRRKRILVTKKRMSVGNGGRGGARRWSVGCWNEHERAMMTSRRQNK